MEMVPGVCLPFPKDVGDFFKNVFVYFFIRSWLHFPVCTVVARKKQTKKNPQKTLLFNFFNKQGIIQNPVDVGFFPPKSLPTLTYNFKFIKERHVILLSGYSSVMLRNISEARKFLLSLMLWLL